MAESTRESGKENEFGIESSLRADPNPYLLYIFICFNESSTEMSCEDAICPRLFTAEKRESLAITPALFDQFVDPVISPALVTDDANVNEYIVVTVSQ